MKVLEDVAVVTRNYNAYDLTSEFLKSLQNLNEKVGQIIVVDDASTDDSALLIKENYPDILLIQLEKFSEYCISFNRGVAKAFDNGAKFVLIVNNDTKNFSKDFFSEMVSCFNKNERVGLVGSLVYDFEDNVLTSADGFVRYGLYVDIPTEGYMISKKCFETVGLFDEKLVRHLEDYDLLIRIRKAGFWSHTCSSVSFDHLGGGTSKKMIWVPNYYRMRNIVWYLKRYGHQFSFTEKLRIEIGFSNKSRQLALQDFNKGLYLRAALILTAACCGFLVGQLTKW